MSSLSSLNTFLFDATKPCAPLRRSDSHKDLLDPRSEPHRPYSLPKHLCHLAIALAGYTAFVAYCTLQIQNKFFDPTIALSFDNSASAVAISKTTDALAWKGFRTDIPMWAQRNPNMDGPFPTKSICFVHVGKTAGTTLACYLGFLYNSCKRHSTKEGIPMAPGLLPVSTSHLMHTVYDDCGSHDFDYYLFIVRDPLHRMQSWFTYELPQNGLQTGKRFEKKKALFTDCAFETLNQLGEEGLMPRDSSNSTWTECQQRAFLAIRGEVGYSTHNFFNFHFYHEQVLNTHQKENVEIVAIRTEHLKDDWRSIEEDILNGPKDLNVSFVQRNKSKKRAEDVYLSERARTRLCHVLCEEIQVYKQILNKAINLSSDDYDIAMDELSESCPEEAALTKCQ